LIFLSGENWEFLASKENNQSKKYTNYNSPPPKTKIAKLLKEAK